MKDLKEKNDRTDSVICGGIVSKTMFDSNPWAYMMAYYMEDKQFDRYVAEKDTKKRRQIFDKYARSAIG